jgi:SagB-type dehydrogenase family enzyme
MTFSSSQIKVFFLILLCGFSFITAQELKVIQLPQPQTETGKPLMQALKLRQSTRSFDVKKIPVQELSNLLWAAYGFNRPEAGRRTVPSAMNWQEYTIYVVLEEGIYVYDAKSNCLSQYASGDFRSQCGAQDFVKTAPLNLLYVADFSKAGKASEDDKKLYIPADCGFIAQNVYLYCASQGLGVVVRGMVDRTKLAETLKLKPEQKVILSQTVGYSK